MKAIKSFMYKNYGATAGDNVTIDDKSVVDELIKKKYCQLMMFQQKRCDKCQS